MYNGTEKEKINIDELVDFLIKRKEGVEEPEQPTPEERDVFAHIQEEPDVFVPDESPEIEPENEPEEEPDPSTMIMPEPVVEEAEETAFFESDKDLKPEMILEFEAKEPGPVCVAPPETAEVVIPKEEAALNEIGDAKPFPMLEPLMQPKKKKKRFLGLFGAKEETEEEDWADWGLKPLGHREPEEGTVSSVEAVTETEPEKELSARADEFPAVTAAADTITMQVVLPSGVAVPKVSSDTKVIPAIPEEELVADPQPQPTPVVIETEEQLPDQLSLEEMVRVEEIEPAAETMEEYQPTETPEELLQRTRQEKVREFTLGGEEEEENEPEDEYAEEVIDEEPIPQDFTGYEDTRVMAEELQYKTRSALWTFLSSGLIELILLLLTLLTALAGESPIPAVGYLSVHLFGLVLLMGLNYAPVGRGLSGLFMLRANSDTAPALVGTVALLDVIVRYADAQVALPYWAPLAGLLLTFCAAGRYLRTLSLRRNFAFVSYRGDKYAATLIEEENAVREIGRRAAGTGEATVGYFHRTGFLTDYLANAGEDHQGDDWSRWMTPTALGVSVLLSLLALLTGGVEGFFGWMTVFTGLLCVTMPVTHLAVQLPLNHCGRVMLSRGGFLVGWKAVRQFGQLDALVVDMADLYPDESMLLHGIKTFSGTHIDEAILSAASLVVRSGGPLSMIFRRIIENKEELLSEVESLVYEQGMGLSGWVDGRRVFVGNRRLLQNHGVDVPSADYEARYAKDGRRLVYLSIAGQLSAMFVVSYLPDPEIQDALQDLSRSHVTLLVRSCDPNISTLDLCESFGLDEYYVDVLPAAAGRAYVQLAEQASETMPAVMASNGHILGTAWALSVCRSLRIKSLIALVIQLLGAGLGAVLCLSWTMLGTLSVFQPLLFILLTSVLTWLAPMFKRT